MSSRTLAAVAFVVSRLAYRIALDVSFDASPARYFLQILDPFFLEHDLARSVLSLHHQAPLFNLVIGLALKCFGDEAWVALDLLFIGLGLWAAIALADIFDRLGLSRAASAAGAALFACSPVTVVYESWLFYSHLVSAVAIIAAALLLRFVAKPTLPRGTAFFAALGVIGLTRSTFGPLWYLLVVAVLVWLAPVPRRLIAKAAAIPLFVLGLHAVKTPLYVGVGYGDAMLWPNLAKKIFSEVPRAEQRRLIKQRRLSPAIRVEPFSDLGLMAPLRVPHEPTGIPALDDARTPTGRANANAIDYALIAAHHSKPDALYLVSHQPKAYAMATLKAIALEPQLATDDSSLPRSPNLHKLEPALRPMRWLVLAPSGGFAPGVLGALLIGIATAVVCLVGRGARALPARRALSAFALVTIGYATAVSVLVSWGDFPRYRYEVDGLYWIFTVLGCAALLARVRRVAWRREPAL